MHVKDQEFDGSSMGNEGNDADSFFMIPKSITAIGVQVSCYSLLFYIFLQNLLILLCFNNEFLSRNNIL